MCKVLNVTKVSESSCSNLFLAQSLMLFNFLSWLVAAAGSGPFSRDLQLLLCRQNHHFRGATLDFGIALLRGVLHFGQLVFGSLCEPLADFARICKGSDSRDLRLLVTGVVPDILGSESSWAEMLPAAPHPELSTTLRAITVERAVQTRAGGPT